MKPLIMLIDDAIAEHPEVTPFGFAPEDDRWTPDHRSQAATCAAFIIAHMHETAQVNRRRTSYSLKHHAEAWGKRTDREPYVANGAFIIAAIALGIRLQRVPETPNCYAALSFTKHAQRELGVPA